MDMHAIMCGHALKSLLCPVDMPQVTLAVADDENHNDIPLLIFTEQHLPTVKPEVLRVTEQSYEDIQPNGVNACLSMADFDTDSFSIGYPYGSI